MEKTCYKEIPLENNHLLQIFDDSRKIGEDAYVVIMTAKIKIPVEKQLFETQDVSQEEFDDILKTLGSPVVYQYRIERNMIMAHEKDGVLESIAETYLENMGQYVAKPQFPAKLVLKEYHDRINKKGK